MNEITQQYKLYLDDIEDISIEVNRILTEELEKDETSDHERNIALRVIELLETHKQMRSKCTEIFDDDNTQAKGENEMSCIPTEITVLRPLLSQARSTMLQFTGEKAFYKAKVQMEIMLKQSDYFLANVLPESDMYGKPKKKHPTPVRRRASRRNSLNSLNGSQHSVMRRRSSLSGSQHTVPELSPTTSPPPRRSSSTISMEYYERSEAALKRYQAAETEWRMEMQEEGTSLEKKDDYDNYLAEEQKLNTSQDTPRTSHDDGKERASFPLVVRSLSSEDGLKGIRAPRRRMKRNHSLDGELPSATPESLNGLFRW